MKHKLLLSLFATLSLTAHADEGMWMLTDLKQQNAAVMQDLGLDISIDQVYCPDNISLKDAVVHFGGGCTGEVISSEGLVLTNHHCGYGYIQQHSSVEHDYLTDGFWAMTREQELPCEGLNVTFIDRILDVTEYVQKQLKKSKDPDGTNYLSPSFLAKVAESCQKGTYSHQRIYNFGTEAVLWSQQILPVCQDILQGCAHGRCSSLFHR